MQKDMESRFEMKTTTVGHANEKDMVAEGKILNRIVRATSSGWEYECDQRHVEVLVEEVELAGTRALSTPGVDEEVNKKEESTLALLGPEMASAYRSLAARCDYIAVDRADAQYAIKELCRDMLAPTEASWSKHVRLGRCFLGRPRAVVMFEYQWQQLLMCLQMPLGQVSRQQGNRLAEEWRWLDDAASSLGKRRRGLLR